MNNELMHHGIKGQKWGVRRYQNKDGSLTLAGKKRALGLQNQYTELSKNKKYHDKNGNLTYAGRKKQLKMKDEYESLTGKPLRKFSTQNSNGGKSKTKTKSVKDMTNQEIQNRIDRIRLENTLNSLTPKETSRGERFVNGLRNAAVGIAKDKGTKIIGDYVDKKVREKLGLKDSKSESDKLKQKAQDYINRQAIDKGQQYFKEGKYAGNKNESGTTKTKTETWSGTVEGEGTSRKKTESSSNRSHVYDDPIDVAWREVNSGDTSRGRDYVNQFLLEDKKRR